MNYLRVHTSTCTCTCTILGKHSSEQLDQNLSKIYHESLMNNTVINSNKTLNFPHKKYSPCKHFFRLTGIEHVRCNSTCNCTGTALSFTYFHTC